MSRNKHTYNDCCLVSVKPPMISLYHTNLIAMTCEYLSA
jgi:hypothetical protein